MRQQFSKYSIASLYLVACIVMYLSVPLCVDAILLRSNSTKSAEVRLLGDLFADYNKDARPVQNVSQAVNVSLDVELSSILGLDEKNERLTSVLWSRMYWNDEFLRWDPQDYDGLQQIRAPVEKLWTPDMVLYNSGSNGSSGSSGASATDGFSINGASLAIVSSDGLVKWLGPLSIISHCSINVHYFPNDVQKCYLQIGSWSYTVNDVDVYQQKEQLTLTNYRANGEFSVEANEITRHVKYFPASDIPFSYLVFNLTLIRKPLFYMCNVFLPCIIIVITILLQFYLPLESGEKISFGTTLLLAMSVFALIMVDKLPANATNLPIVSELFVVMMLMTSVSIMMAMAVLQIHHRRSEHRLPRWLRRVLLPTKDEKLDGAVLRRSHFWNDAFYGDENKEATNCNGQKIEKRSSRNVDDVIEADVEIREVRTDDLVDYSKEHQTAALKLNLYFFIVFSFTFLIYSISVMVRFFGKH